MLILALDTTTRSGSVAVTDDDVVLAVVHGDAARTHGERLPGEIEQALETAGVERRDLQLLAVASGPGAFTGLRIGLAAIQGLAMVLDIPVVGVSALDALALEAWTAHRPHDLVVMAWMDAARGEVFAGDYRATSDAADTLVRVRDPFVASPVRVLAVMAEHQAQAAVCVGDGAVRYRHEIETSGPVRWRVVETPNVISPAIARIGRRLAADGLAGPPHALQPLYVRRPDAELERLRRADA